MRRPKWAYGPVLDRGANAGRLLIVRSRSIGLRLVARQRKERAGAGRQPIREAAGTTVLTEMPEPSRDCLSGTFPVRYLCLPPGATLPAFRTGAMTFGHARHQYLSARLTGEDRDTRVVILLGNSRSHATAQRGAAREGITPATAMIATQIPSRAGLQETPCTGASGPGRLAP